MSRSMRLLQTEVLLEMNMWGVEGLSDRQLKGTRASDRLETDRDPITSPLKGKYETLGHHIIGLDHPVGRLLTGTSLKTPRSTNNGGTRRFSCVARIGVNGWIKEQRGDRHMKVGLEKGHQRGQRQEGTTGFDINEVVVVVNLLGLMRMPRVIDYCFAVDIEVLVESFPVGRRS
ncbi:hypothetical protein TREMEDRAFT_59474 [Tremella mesenterica DSM 1558]|uniref:uncharacterized protein n=1 Tax=Tremella mesenterica (strain ATCC 24925 / CBS 8224 / DSM 1558 / NBRC 9311 / NRRL Y-6157 / RJB 2259-6 / UBC 559-6) TaxID=578456 RepID=UPI0003F4A648|nr:uncharacterized protein TREMEDRAFT_59474 [Tremella mesenterica DSM 1558]EIW73310.1 hypothetical protein TREMEDRAFT_59474 [Tremella mesenterica DSM 1558]